MNYVYWALLGMVGYSATTLFVKFAVGKGAFSSFVVLSIAVAVVVITVWAITALKGDFKGLSGGRIKSAATAWSIATGAVLALAVISLFKALSMGPASVVVPIYGMFIVGGAVLGMVFLKEPVSPVKILGILLAVAGVYLITKS
jgi:transporter family protein